MLLRVLFIVQFALISSLTFGQTKLGLTAGLNFANSTVITLRDKGEVITRVNAGIYSEFSLSDKVNIEAILLYSVKGWYFEANEPHHNIHGTMNMHYLNLQLMGKFILSKKLSLLLGVEPGYLIHIRRTNSFDLMADAYEKKDIGLIIGAGFKINELLSISLKYIHGRRDFRQFNVYDFNGNVIEVETDGRHRVFQLGFVYSIFQK